MVKEKNNSDNKDEESLAVADNKLDIFEKIPVEISVVIGKTILPIEKVIKMGRGSLLELDQNVGDPLDVYINDKLIAKAELIVVNDKIGITFTEMIKD